MTASEFGGSFSVFPDGEFDEDSVTWANSPYSTVVGVNAGNIEGPIEEKTFYLKDITKQFTNGIPKTLVIRIESDNANGVMYRSPAGNAAYGPKLQVVFASDPAKESWIELFGTYAPTPAPTIDPEWENPKTISDPPRDYFNYNPRSRYGPGKWEDVREDGWYQQYWRIDADLDRNRCASGERQSPQDLCETRDECVEFHMPRTRVSYISCSFCQVSVSLCFEVLMIILLHRPVNMILMMSRPQLPSPPRISCTTNSASPIGNGKQIE